MGTDQEDGDRLRHLGLLASAIASCDLRVAPGEPGEPAWTDGRAVFVDAAPGFYLVVSYYPGYQSVLKDIEDSTRQRMVAIEFGFPPAAVEEEVVAHEAGIERGKAAELVRFGQAIRRLEAGGLREVASTRALIAAGQLISDGLGPRDAARAAIAGPLTDDAAMTRGLAEMIDVYPAEAEK